MLEIMINDLRELRYRLAYVAKCILWRLVWASPFIATCLSFVLFSWIASILEFSPGVGMVTAGILSILSMAIIIWIDSIISRMNPPKYDQPESALERFSLDKLLDARDTLDEQLKRTEEDD